jgi:prepilin-type N-terminal cleavage/methylation domain-containing protein
MSPAIHPHDQPSNQQVAFASPRSRHGFSLVEMLVVITVILVLLGVSLAVMNVSLEGERVRSGARQIQSYLAGARDRAAYLNRPCGVRFIRDQLQVDNSVVHSMVYIELPADWKQGSFFAFKYELTPGEDTNNNGNLDNGEDDYEDLDGDRILDTEDTNRNGLLDTEDTNGNGLLDTSEDINGNGLLDTEDLNGNGTLDTEDVNGDGALNLGNGNGQLDPVIPAHSLLVTENAYNGRFDTEDLNGDGFLNLGNGNGVLDPGEDKNGNNRLDPGEDRWEDANNNGNLDNEDSNGNGVLDPGEDKVTSTTEWHLVLAAGNEDTNGNGLLDPTEDTNGNGQLDPGEDTNNNGRLDLTEDLNGNGTIDTAWVNKPKIQIGSHWHTVETFFFWKNGRQCLRVIPPYPVAFGSRISANGYRLQLQPVIMAGQDPVLFPSGVVIDLDQCRAAHREDTNNNGALDPGEDLDLDGFLDPGTPLALPASWLDSGGGYRQSLDILFSPNGTVFGSAAARGIVHLVVNDSVDSTRNFFPIDLPGAAATNQSDKRVVSLFTRTGAATTSELTTPPEYTLSGNQFYFAERGKSE